MYRPISPSAFLGNPDSDTLILSSQVYNEEKDPGNQLESILESILESGTEAHRSCCFNQQGPSRSLTGLQEYSNLSTILVLFLYLQVHFAMASRAILSVNTNAILKYCEYTASLLVSHDTINDQHGER